MRSIAGHIDPATIAAQIRMERQVHRGCFLLVEGSTDAKRIDKFVDENACSLVNCYGKTNVVDAIALMRDVGLEDCLGMIDADFDRITGAINQEDGIIVSAFHDFDLDNALTEVIDRYLEEVADEAKVAALGGARPCLWNLLSVLKPLSILRYANELRGLRYDLTRLNLEDFFDGRSVDIERMIDAVSRGRFGTTHAKDRLRGEITQLMPLQFDLLLLTNGHDFMEALGIALRDHLGKRKVPQTWRTEIEMHIRFGRSREDFATTEAYRGIRQWEAGSGALRVLKC